jgi:diadenosine tetraphosphate (Ap4A) HIT family hydrolase
MRDKKGIDDKGWRVREEGKRRMDHFVPGCLSCDLLTGRRSEPGGTIYENEHWHVASVVAPIFWRGFLIVKLRRHCEQLADLTPAEAASLGPVLQATCQALTRVLKPAKVYVCSFGDGVKHIHFWVLPRPPEMRAGMHPVFLQLDLRAFLTRRLGVKRWLISDEEVADLATRLREEFQRHPLLSGP